jgi:hypothetical protein
MLRFISPFSLSFNRNHSHKDECAIRINFFTLRFGYFGYHSGHYA